MTAETAGSTFSSDSVLPNISKQGLKVKFAYPFAAVWPKLIKIIVKKSMATTVARLLVKSAAGQRQMMTNGATANRSAMSMNRPEMSVNGLFV